MTDVESWLLLRTDVEPLFGPMPDFAPVLLRNVERRSALVVHDVSGEVAGGLLVGGTVQDPRLTWLAVRAGCRGRGVGTSLVSAALRRLSKPCHVSVITFGPDNPEGQAARRLYERLGFTAGEMVDAGPDGGSRQRYFRSLGVPDGS